MTSAAGPRVGFRTWAKGGKRRFKAFLTIGRPHITAIAALGAFTFGWLFTGRYLWFLTSVVALDWYVVNLINRVEDVEEDRINAIAGTNFVRSRRRSLRTWGLALLFSSLLAVHFVIPAVTGLRVLYHLLGAAYNWPILPGNRRLKTAYFWKNTASAAGFMITVFGYPLALAGWGAEGFPPGVGWTCVAVSGAFFFLFELSYEVIYDLRDVKGDALAGVKTYPVVHGEAAAVRIADGLILASMTILSLGYAFSAIPWRIFIMVVPPALQLLFYKRAMRRGIRAEDCIQMTWTGAGLIVVYHLWVAAGLPGVGL